MSQIIRIPLTSQQILTLRPLFDEMRLYTAKGESGAILGQPFDAWGGNDPLDKPGTAKFTFVDRKTFERIQKILKERKR